MPEIKTKHKSQPVLNTAQQHMQRSFVRAKQEQAVPDHRSLLGVLPSDKQHLLQLVIHNGTADFNVHRRNDNPNELPSAVSWILKPCFGIGGTPRY